MDERVSPAYVTDNDLGIKYTLDFNRESVIFAQNRGFSLTDEYVNEHLRTVYEDLFYYAFRMYHRNVARANVDKLREKWGGLPNKLIERLALLYGQALTANNIQDDEESAKNASVTLEL